MKKLTEEFKTTLYQTIEDIESNSQVEIVAIIKPESSKYRAISFASGAVLLFLTFSFLMYVPWWEFEYFLIYFLAIISFFVGFGLVEFIPPIKRLFLSKKLINRNVEIYGRAIFQKAGIRHTKEKIGVLIFTSLFEKKTIILKDRGAKTSVPAEEWEQIDNNFKKIFNAPDFQKSLIENLKNCKDVFSKYIPSVEDDINELPDDLTIDL